MRGDPIRSQEGSALLLVLVLLTILSLALGAMFANAGANLTMSTVVTGQDNKVYAADGGVEYAIQKLRANSAPCSGPLPSTTINGRTVDVNCEPQAGQATSVSPWALVTTDPTDPSLTTQSAAQIIDGPVYVSGGMKLDKALTVNGDVLQTGTCPLPANLTVVGTYVAACATTLPIPGPAPSLPPPVFTQQTPKSPQPTYTTADGCSIWTPGTYTSISLGTDNYFASGIYYFKDTSINLTGKSAIGGQPGPDYQPSPGSPLPPTPCSAVTDQTAGVSDGFGVEFILGGTSTISVNDSGGPPAQLELFARVPGSSPEGTPGISIRTVPQGTRWEPTTAGHPVVLSSKGANPRLAVYGYVYVPEGSVTVDADGNVPLAGGLFCWRAVLNSSASSFAQISAQSGASWFSRSVIITATAKGDPGQKDITSTSVVGIGNDAARTVDIQSWVTSNP